MGEGGDSSEREGRQLIPFPTPAFPGGCPRAPVCLPPRGLRECSSVFTSVCGSVSKKGCGVALVSRKPAPPPGPPHPASIANLFCPRRMAFSSLPYLFLIHLTPCSWASTMRGQRSVLHRMVAFSVDMRSLGRPWLFHVATSASSVSRLKGSRPSVMGMGTWGAEGALVLRRADVASPLPRQRLPK